MRGSRTIIAFLATAAIVVGCTGGGGGGSAAPSAEPPASEPAPSESGGASPSEAGSAACNPPRQEGVTLTFVSFGGVYQEAQRKAWLEPYTELTGVQFTEDENSSNATIKAQVEAGQVTWDVVDVGNDFGLDVHADLLEPLDFNLIPKDELNADLGITDYRIPDITYGVVLAYNTEVLGAGNVPQGWADYFDTAKFPGKRGAWDYSEGGMFEFALMATASPPTSYTRSTCPGRPPSSTRSRTTSSSGPRVRNRRSSSAPARSP
jgi:putative spermidine/putrescine transport system substrate-binding protein